MYQGYGQEKDGYDNNQYYDQTGIQQPVPVRPVQADSRGWDSQYQEYPNESQVNYNNKQPYPTPNPAQQGQYQNYQQGNNGQNMDQFINLQGGFENFSQFQNSAAAQLGVQLGQNAMQAGSKYMEQNVGRFINIPKLKHYFNVSNGYVLNKLRLLLFPFSHKSWSRKLRTTENNGQIESYCPPREDINAPDLYIPVTAFVTYILVVGVAAGRESFKPELLGKTASTALGVIFFEVMLLKLGCYLFSVTSDTQLLDLISYCGYKFIGIIVSILVGKLAFEYKWIFYVAFIYTCMATGFFLLRSLRHIVLPESSMSVGNAFRKRRVNLLFGIAAIQLFSCWLLTV
ncbi:ER to Golgi transporter Yif1 [Neoconidiobolus thromboides FSU 785]|nr:ER to Golgi transporter Yif1 [Neoconidiobolus thromboides FSU 785]